MSLAESIIYDTEQTVIELINSGVDLNEQDRFGLRPLIQAVICRKFHVLEYLLQKGANIEQKDFLNRTALHWAADRNEHDMCLYLLSQGANANNFSAEGQPILVNPILREQVKLVDLFIEYGADYQFAQDFINAKLLGHRFELLGETDIANNKNQFIPVSFEGFYLEFTSGLINRSLFNFINSIAGHKYQRQQQQLKKVMQALKDAGTLSEYAKYKDKSQVMPMIDKILNSANLLLLPVAYRGHAITFIIYQDMLAICNRGVSTQVDTTIIYQIGNRTKLGLDLYKKLLYEFKEEQFMEEDLYQDLALKPLATFPTSHQITGNCSWANVEASVPAMLLMQIINIQSSFEEITHAKKAINTLYKSWINWDKDTALDEAIEDFEASSGIRQLAKAFTLNAILVQRCDPRHNADLNRAKKILHLLANPEFKFILRNDLKVSHKKNTNNFAGRLLKLFKKANLDLENLELMIPVNFDKSNIHADNLVRMTTALHVAALEGDLNTAEHLINDLNFDVNYLDRTGSTPLMYAAWKGHEKLVAYLLAHGADPTIKNLKGGYALGYAIYAKRANVVKLLKDYHHK